jgi:hypothetical protein
MDALFAANHRLITKAAGDTETILTPWAADSAHFDRPTSGDAQQTRISTPRRQGGQKISRQANFAKASSAKDAKTQRIQSREVW